MILLLRMSTTNNDNYNNNYDNIAYDKNKCTDNNNDTNNSNDNGEDSKSAHNNNDDHKDSHKKDDDDYDGDYYNYADNNLGTYKNNETNNTTSISIPVYTKQKLPSYYEM